MRVEETGQIKWKKKNGNVKFVKSESIYKFISKELSYKLYPPPHTLLTLLCLRKCVCVCLRVRMTLFLLFLLDSAFESSFLSVHKLFYVSPRFFFSFSSLSRNWISMTSFSFYESFFLCFILSLDHSTFFSTTLIFKLRSILLSASRKLTSGCANTIYREEEISWVVLLRTIFIKPHFNLSRRVETYKSLCFQSLNRNEYSTNSETSPLR